VTGHAGAADLGEYLIDALVARFALGVELEHGEQWIGLEPAKPRRQSGGGQCLSIPKQGAGSLDGEPVDRRRRGGDDRRRPGREIERHLVGGHRDGHDQHDQDHKHHVDQRRGVDRGDRREIGLGCGKPPAPALSGRGGHHCSPSAVGFNDILLQQDLKTLFPASAAFTDGLASRGNSGAGQVSETVAILLEAGLVSCLALILLLAVLLVRERAARRAAEGALAAGRDEAADQAARLALLDRRRAAIAPIEALWFAWAGGGRPSEALLADAARALAEARLLFAGHLQAELDEAALLIVAHARGQSWQRVAIEAGRHDERADLIDEEIARERAIRPRIADLRIRLVDAARMS
jgi:hypothetical protein